MCLQGTEDHRAWSAYGWLGRLSPSEPVQGQLEHDIVQDELPCFCLHVVCWLPTFCSSGPGGEKKQELEVGLTLPRLPWGGDGSPLGWLHVSAKEKLLVMKRHRPQGEGLHSASPR